MIGAERERRRRHLIARLVVGQEGLAATLRPTHGPTEAPGGPKHQPVFGIGKVLHAEAAAHIGGDDAYPLHGNPEDPLGELLPQQMHVLGRGMQGEATARGVVLSDGAPRLQRRRRQTVVHQVEGGDVRGRGEGPVDGPAITAFPIDADVVRGSVPDVRGRARPYGSITRSSLRVDGKCGGSGRRRSRMRSAGSFHSPSACRLRGSLIRVKDSIQELPCSLALGVLEQLGRGSLLFDGAVVKEADTVRDLLC